LALSAPEPLSAADDVGAFDCGNDLLNDWLGDQAVRSEGHSARTYAVKDGARVVGYYCLATGGVAREGVPRKIRQGLPRLVLVMVLGRLAVDLSYRGRGIGWGMSKDALLRTLQVSREVGVRAMLVHAIDDEAKAFYAAHGFIEFPASTRTLFLAVETIARGL
jgi:GNAT superfamily N-acetyltransferase